MHAIATILSADNREDCFIPLDIQQFPVTERPSLGCEVSSKEQYCSYIGFHGCLQNVVEKVNVIV